MERAESLLIGLAGWGDHDELYHGATPVKDKLKTYGGHFPLVEVDTSFYAVQPVSNYERWVADTPPGFRFLIKAYQGMTGHQRERDGRHRAPDPLIVRRVLEAMAPTGSIDASEAGELAGLFRAFRESIEPVVAAGKLFAVLFQYPPWFECTRESVETLRWAKAAMGELPVALEFRHQSWFTPQMRERTLSFMEKEGWIHSICDEPQAGSGSVPTVLQATHPEKTVVRFHGRNAAGWHSSGQPNWRDVRYLYHYTEAELAEWQDRLQRLQQETAQTAVIFNNNSGGHAAGNAKQLMRLLGLDYEGLAPRQLDLF